MQTVGMRPVVVHGGGKAITVAMEKAGLTPHWVKGRRYTDDATLEIVARVLAEEINADIERHINKFGGRASGLHHKTHQCLYGRKLMLPDGDGRLIDLGRVGEVTEVDTTPIENLCLAGVVPVLPSLAEDEEEEGKLLNVNADTAAAAVAQAIRAEKLVFLTDTPGILRDCNEPGSLISGLTPEECRGLIARGVIDKGMIPKVEACLNSPRSRGPQDPHHRRPAAALVACWRSSPRAGSAPRSSAMKTATRRQSGPPPRFGPLITATPVGRAILIVETF